MSYVGIATFASYIRLHPTFVSYVRIATTFSSSVVQDPPGPTLVAHEQAFTRQWIESRTAKSMHVIKILVFLN